MEDFKKILNESVDGAHDIWLSEATMNGLIHESKIRIEEHMMNLECNGFDILVDLQAGKLFDAEKSRCCYYRVESVGTLYKRNAGNTSVVIL